MNRYLAAVAGVGMLLALAHAADDGVGAGLGLGAEDGEDDQGNCAGNRAVQCFSRRRLL